MSKLILKLKLKLKIILTFILLVCCLTYKNYNLFLYIIYTIFVILFFLLDIKYDSKTEKCSSLKINPFDNNHLSDNTIIINEENDSKKGNL